MPTTAFPRDELEKLRIVEILVRCGLTKSNGEGLRLIKDGGLTLGDARVEDGNAVIEDNILSQGAFVLRKGKKVYHRVVVG